MDKFLIKNQKKDASISKTIRTNESRVEQKRPHIELDMDDIVADPGLRKPIDEFPMKLEMMLKELIYKWVHVNHLVIHFHG
jgi:hypothetical protein